MLVFGFFSVARQPSMYCL